MDKIGVRTAQAIRERAKQNGTSVRQECQKINVLPGNISNWEKGKVNPTAYFLQEMALAGYDVIWILTGRKYEN